MDEFVQLASGAEPVEKTVLAYARQLAFSMLARREHGRLELQQKLEAKGVVSQVAKHIIAELVVKDLQSDARYCEMMVRSRSNRGVGPRRIHYELTSKGVDLDVVQHFLAAVDWQEVLWVCWKKKFKTRLPLKDWPEYAKQQRFLLQRGFSPEAIRRLLASKS